MSAGDIISHIATTPTTKASGVAIILPVADKRSSLMGVEANGAPG
jgi:hypothetical protein